MLTACLIAPRNGSFCDELHGLELRRVTLYFRILAFIGWLVFGVQIPRNISNLAMDDEMRY